MDYIANVHNGIKNRNQNALFFFQFLYYCLKLMNSVIDAL